MKKNSIGIISLFFICITLFLFFVCPREETKVMTQEPIIIADELAVTPPQTESRPPQFDPWQPQLPQTDPPCLVPDPPCAASGKVKSWTDYRVYSKYYPQGKLQKYAHTDENGLRKVGEYYCVALGSFYGDVIGTTYEIILLDDDGYYKWFYAILADQKSDKHTDPTHRFTEGHGCMIEFAIDSKVAQRVNSIVYTGNVSTLPQFSGSIIAIRPIGYLDLGQND